METKKKEPNRIISVQLSKDEFAMLARRVGKRNRSEYLRDVLRRDLEKPTHEDEQERHFRELSEEMQALMQEILWLRTFLVTYHETVEDPKLMQEIRGNVEVAWRSIQKRIIKVPR